MKFEKIENKCLKRFHRFIRLTPVYIVGMMLFLAGSTIIAQDAKEIIERMEQVMTGDSQYAEMTMKVERPRYEREISLRSWLKERDYSLILITAPARDNGTVYLMRENDIWNYDPRIDRVTRLPSSMMSQSWMGSDFTNDDLVRDTDLIEDFEHEIVRTEEYLGRNSYVIELVPKPGRPIVWGKVNMWICADEYIQLRVENFDQRFELVNTMELDEIREFGNRNIPTRITVTPADKENERTILTYHEIEFDIDIDLNFFSRANMQRVR